MKTFWMSLLSGVTLLTMLTACGPSEQEQQQREQARKDSLEQVRQQQAQQQRMDSIAQAKKQAEADSLAAQKKKEEEEARNPVKFDPNGPIAVQVEAWRSRDKAQQQVSKWRERGFPNAYVVKHGNPDTGNIWFRVRLGRVASIEMAERLGKRLQQEYNEKYWIAEVAGEGTTPDATD